MFVFAQLSTSVSDEKIRLVIIALLVVAVLLAGMTIWYFVKTSPSRRVRVAQARRQAAPGQRAAAGRPASSGASASATAASPRTAGASSIADEALIDVDEGDEWERLTAPEPRRPASN